MNIIQDFASRAGSFLRAAGNPPVFPAPASIARLSELDLPLQDLPVDPLTVMAELDDIGSPAAVKCVGGRYYGFVIGGTLPAALGAKLMATVWDQNAALHVSSPVAAALEDIAGRWLLDVLRLPPESGFGFVTGDTMANFTGLAAARYRVLKNAGWDVEAKGLFGAPEIRVIVGGEVHVSLLNTLAMLGLGRERVTVVPADEQGRIYAGQVPVIDGPTIVCLQSGNVNSGAFDDVGAVCRAKGKNTWVHVDAAFGLWAAVSPAKMHLLNGVELADSWATDAHKWLNVPYDCGVVFVRDKAALFAAMSGSPAAYLPTDAKREPFQYVPELSRQARGVPVWAALRSLGRKGLEELVDRHCRQAGLFASKLQEAGITVLNEVVLNQVLAHFGDDDRTVEVIKKIQQEGTCWCGGTKWQGKQAMRISVSNWITTDEDVEAAAESMIRNFKLS